MTKEQSVDSLITFIERKYIPLVTTWKPYGKELEQARELLREQITKLSNNVELLERLKQGRIRKKNEQTNTNSAGVNR